MLSQTLIPRPNNDLVVDGDVVVRNRQTRIRLDSQTGSIFAHNINGDTVFQWEMPGNNLRWGGHGEDADLAMFNERSTNLRNTSQAVFHFNSQRGVARIGGNQTAGRLVCLDSDNNQTIFLDGANGNARVGAIVFPDGSIQNTAAATGVITEIIAGNGLSVRGSSGDVEISISQDLLRAIVDLGRRVQTLEFNLQQLQFTVGQIVEALR